MIGHFTIDGKPVQFREGQTIMEAALDSIITIDEGERIIEFNSTAEQMFGYWR